jgi:hypothetical protein
LNFIGFRLAKSTWSPSQLTSTNATSLARQYIVENSESDRHAYKRAHSNNAPTKLSHMTRVLSDPRLHLSVGIPWQIIPGRLVQNQRSEKKR